MMMSSTMMMTSAASTMLEDSTATLLASDVLLYLAIMFGGIMFLFFWMETLQGYCVYVRFRNRISRVPIPIILHLRASSVES